MGSKPTRKAARTSNRKHRSKGAKPRREPLDPAARKVRNRTILGLGLLGLINLYVFGLHDSGLGALGRLETATIGTHSGPLAAIADPPEKGCGGDPIRVFEGLEDLIQLEVELREGRTLRLGLLELGIDRPQIDDIEAAVRTHIDLSLLAGSGAVLRVATDRNGRIHALESEISEGHVVQACRRDRDATGTAGFEVRNIEHPLRVDVEVVRLRIGDDADLSAAVLEAGEKPELANLVAAQLASDVDFTTEARPGDDIRVMIEKRWLGRRFHRYGAILAIRFTGHAARVSYYRYQPELGQPGYFDDKGRPMARQLLHSPVAYFHVAPDARGLLAPALELVQGRLGVTYRLPEGAPLQALGDGIVSAIERTQAEGLTLELQLSDGQRARYGHLSRLASALEEGTPVRQGQLVALAGHSGRTPTDRLRLELWPGTADKAEPLDPLEAMGHHGNSAAVVGEPIPESMQARFAADIEPAARALRAKDR